MGTDFAHVDPRFKQTLTDNTQKEVLLPEGQEAHVADDDGEVSFEESEVGCFGGDVVGCEMCDIYFFISGHFSNFNGI